MRLKLWLEFLIFDATASDMDFTGLLFSFDFTFNSALTTWASMAVGEVVGLLSVLVLCNCLFGELILCGWEAILA